MSGRDFRGEKVGTVEPIESIKTDRWRLDSYTYELAAAQNQLYAGYGEERFSRFRKTFGYANMPLDGIWLRAPYLHNGSVPTLRDLLNDAGQRPKVFYRGYDVFDPKKVGFVSDVPEETPAGAAANPHLKGRAYFRFDTQPIPAKSTAGCVNITAVHPDSCEEEIDRPLPANIRKLKIVSGNAGGAIEEVLVARRDHDGRRLTTGRPRIFPIASKRCSRI